MALLLTPPSMANVGLRTDMMTLVKAGLHMRAMGRQVGFSVGGLPSHRPTVPRRGRWLDVSWLRCGANPKITKPLFSQSGQECSSTPSSTQRHPYHESSKLAIQPQTPFDGGTGGIREELSNDVIKNSADMTPDPGALTSTAPEAGNRNVWAGYPTVDLGRLHTGM